MKTSNVLRYVFLLLAPSLGAVCLAAEPAAAPNRTAALADAAAGHWESAEPVLVALAQPEPCDVDACLWLSRHRLEQHQTKEALDLINRAATAAPKRADVQFALGQALSVHIGEVNFIQQGFIARRMLSAFKTTVALEPNHLGAWIGLSRYYLNAPAIAGGSIDKALECASELEKRNPYLGALEKAGIADQTGKDTDAVAFYEKAASLNLSAPQPLVSLGNLHLKQGRIPAARTAFESALQRAPGFSPAQEGLKKIEAN